MERGGSFSENRRDYWGEVEEKFDSYRPCELIQTKSPATRRGLANFSPSNYL
jgi:hypothetical protein